MNFKEWEEQAVSEATLEISRDITRDIYTFPNGTKVYHEVCMPWNPFKPQSEWALLDKELPVSMIPDLKKQGIGLDTERYSPDGFGIPVFSGEQCLEKAFNFATRLPA